MDNEQDIAGIPTVSVTMLGGFSLQAGSDILTDEINRSQKLWNVLCYLIAHRNRTVPQSEFIELFWPTENSSNPVNALKTLLYRVRALLEPMFPEGMEPILSQRGSYSWNNAIVCDLDTDRFERLCQLAQSTTQSDEIRMEFYQEATTLYRGDYLPKLAGQLWVVSLSARYHALYIEAVKAYAALLERAARFEDMAALCDQASQLDPLDEGIHTLTVLSLLRQGKDSAALARYDLATDLLYRNLGVRPSEELSALYVEIMNAEKIFETDLGVIQSNLKEAAARPGAFFCEYGFFKEAYRLEARRSTRSGTCVHIALVTVSLPDSGLPALGILTTTMEQLLDILVCSLRQGDVIARYSGAQYIVMLPTANFEDSTMVMGRVVTAFYRQHRRNFLKISFKIRELDLI